jgi:hypothetical protein
VSTEPQTDDQPLPVNLHFPDQRALTVDIDSVMSRGLRMRRNRKVLAGVVAAVAIGALGVSAACLAPASSTSAPAVSKNRVTVLASEPNPMAPGYNVSVVAWISGRRICSGLDFNNPAHDTVTCVNRPSALSAAAPTVLAPRVVADFTDEFGRQVAIGFVSGDVTKVSLKIRGQLYDAAVVPLPGSTATGAYMVWIGGGDFVTSGQDFTQITGYDSQGAVITGDHP